jgi:hypothetical protein
MDFDSHFFPWKQCQADQSATDGDGLLSYARDLAVVPNCGVDSHQSVRIRRIAPCITTSKVRSPRR